MARIPSNRAGWAEGAHPGGDPESTVSLAPVRDGDDGVPPGTMLGDYQVERTLARGGMGTVFAAVHPLIGKRVAIKVLSRAQCSDPDSVERFVDEARVVNRIGHPNIIDVFAFGAMPDGRQYLVMELLQGETLGARMAREGVSLADACSVMRQLARALAAAHAQGVIHRDLKPDNVFLATVDGGSMVKLLDFGIAKLSYRDALTRTAVGVMMGTPQYIAPEQALGDEVDARSDIYAFGGILFELLAGRPAFVVRSPAEAIAKHLMEPAPRVSQFARVWPELDDLVAAMLAKEPEERPGLDRVCDVLDRATVAPQGLLAPPLAGGSSGTAIAIPAVPVSAPAAVLPAGSSPVRSGSSRAAARRSRLWGLAGSLALVAGVLALVYIARLHAESTPKPHAPIAASAAPPQAPVVTPPDPAAAPTAPTPPVTSPSEPPAAAAAAEPADPPADAARPAVTASAGDGTPRAPRSPLRRTGRLALAIRGVRSYVVVVDGVARGARSELALAPGPHTIEVRADGEPPRRFAVQIEAGKTEQRDVVWAHDAPPSAPAAADGDDHALMGPGQAVPRETSHP